MIEKILKSINNFDLDLKVKCVLTEVATGDYVVTPIIVALAGANVYAYAKF